MAAVSGSLAFALATYTFATQLVSAVYEAAQRRGATHGGGHDSCYGPECFRLTFVVCFVACAVGMALATILARRSRERYAMLCAVSAGRPANG